MFKFIEFLKKRPKDKTIRLMRAVFGLIVLALLGIFFNDYHLLLPANLQDKELYIKYALFLLGIIPLIMSLDFCFAKRKYVRILQAIFAILFFYAGSHIAMNATVSETPKTGSGSIDVTAINTTKKGPVLDLGFWIAFLGILPLFAGVTGKCITQKCFKYGETITKIRV